jgi:hypothetical protein
MRGAELVQSKGWIEMTARKCKAKHGTVATEGGEVGKK